MPLLTSNEDWLWEVFKMPRCNAVERTRTVERVGAPETQLNELEFEIWLQYIPNFGYDNLLSRYILIMFVLRF